MKIFKISATSMMTRHFIPSLFLPLIEGDEEEIHLLLKAIIGNLPLPLFRKEGRMGFSPLKTGRRASEVMETYFRGKNP